MHYTIKQLKFLARGYQRFRIPELTSVFNARFKTNASRVAIKSTIKSTISNHSITCGRHPGFPVGYSRIFSKAEHRWLVKNYRNHSLKELHLFFNKRFHRRLRLTQIRVHLKNNGITSGRTGFFPKGNEPWNSGTKGMGICKGNSGNFKKGNIPANRRPVGAERIDSKDGYILVKVRERNPYTGTPTRFKKKHVVVWERIHGPVPKGSAIIFKDGNILNFSKRNLVCVTRSELLRLNQLHYHDCPKETKPIVFTLAKFKDRIGKAIHKEFRSCR